MRFEDLLEKKEAKQIYLIKQLLVAGGQMNVHEMGEKLFLSKKSIEHYIEDLQYLLQAYPCQLTYDGAMITFSKKTDFDLTSFEKKFYFESPKFQILWYLLEEKEINPIQLSQQLLISESSLSRKIKELNQLLQEFQLRIWQGKLLGEESQIRYFYFQLLWYLKKGYRHERIQESNLIENIERALQLSFSPIAKKRLLLWLRITKKRMTISGMHFDKLRTKFSAYSKDPLFLTIRTMIRRFYGFYAVEVKEEEAMLHFVFLVGMSILSEQDFQHYSLKRVRLPPTSWCDTVILENLLRIYGPKKIRKELEASCYYHLSQIHIRLYFFKGDVEIYNRENIWLLEEKLSTRDIQSDAKELLQLACRQLAIDYNKADSLLAMTAIKYLSVMTIVDVQVNREIKVAIYLQADSLFKEAATSMLMLQLKSLNGVVFQKYEPSQTYDLVITNTDLQTNSPLYRITELGSNYDLQEIQKMIHQI